jgi:hypothetical protein
MIYLYMSAWALNAFCGTGIDDEERELKVLVARQNLKRVSNEAGQAEKEERERIRKVEEDRLAREEHNARLRTEKDDAHRR